MTPSPKKRPRSRWKTLLLVLAALVCVLAAWIGLTALYIARHVTDDARHADAIVVFGAAEYAGRPSPVFKARLDHAFDLYQKGLAPVVITTGGAGEDPVYTEGGVGRDYLSRRGIPDSHLIAETQADDTAESAQRVSAILRTNGWHTVVSVSDAYHIFRIKEFFDREGVLSYGSARPGSIPKTREARALGSLREALSLTFWRIIPMRAW